MGEGGVGEGVDVDVYGKDLVKKEEKMDVAAKYVKKEEGGGDMKIEMRGGVSEADAVMVSDDEDDEL